MMLFMPASPCFAKNLIALDDEPVKSGKNLEFWDGLVKNSQAVRRNDEAFSATPHPGFSQGRFS